MRVSHITRKRESRSQKAAIFRNIGPVHFPFRNIGPVRKKRSVPCPKAAIFPLGYILVRHYFNHTQGQNKKGARKTKFRQNCTVLLLGVVCEFIVLSRVGMAANAFFTVGAEIANVKDACNFCKERRLMMRTAPNCQREDCGKER